jgi:hypothetical protein
LAFISILWSRLDFVSATPLIQNVHHYVIVGICALPLVLSLPQKVRVGMHLSNRGGIPQWPPYYAPALNNEKIGIKGWTTPKQIVFSDQPWAVAWYADRISVWLPPTREGFQKIETLAADLQTPVAGILISPSSHGSGPVSEVATLYKDFTSLVLDGRVIMATYPPGTPINDKNSRIQDITRRYPHRQALVGMEMVYYSEKANRDEMEINP